VPPTSDLLPATARTAGRALLAAIAGGEPAPPGYIVNLRMAVSSLTWEPGKVVAGFVFTDEVCSLPGIVFGGYAAAIHDQIGGMVMLSVLPDTLTFVTTRLDTRFLKALRPGPATVEAEVSQLSDGFAQVEVAIVQDGVATSRSVLTQSLRSIPSR
jgi:acyl-coenzyme A thioesterase PaaI-like protein